MRAEQVAREYMYIISARKDTILKGKIFDHMESLMTVNQCLGTFEKLEIIVFLQ